MMSTTRMAISHRELPLFLRLLWKQRGGVTSCNNGPFQRLRGFRSLPEGLVSRCVDDQHARDPDAFFFELHKHNSG